MLNFSLEKYKIANSFDLESENYIKNFNEKNTIASNFTKINVPTTTYFDPSIGEVKLKCYKTKFIVSEDEVKSVDFLTVRSNFFKEILSQVQVMNQDTIKLMDSAGWIYNPRKNQSFIDWFLNNLTQWSKSGSDLKDIKFSKATGTKILKELNNSQSRLKMFTWLQENIK